MAYYRETSTMISDMVLSACSFLAGTLRMNRMRAFSWRYTTMAWFSLFGFSFIGFAALLGVFRFGYFFPRRQYSLQGWHSYFSHIAAIVGRICIDLYMLQCLKIERITDIIYLYLYIYFLNSVKGRWAELKLNF